MAHRRRPGAWWRWSPLGLTGCGHGTSGDLARAQLAGVTWQLEAIERDSGDVVTVDDPSRYTARFGEDGRVTVRSDCNVCAGTCHLDRPAGPDK
jgi:hypothetical protein